ncbi:MAG: DNA translocase FtsK, partial [Bacilli bacterium]
MEEEGVDKAEENGEETQVVIHDFDSRVDVITNSQIERNGSISEIDQESIDPARLTSEDVLDNKVIAIEQEPFTAYTLPPFSMLTRPKKSGKSDEHKDITANAKKLETTLESFGVHAKVTQIHRGPAVTRYEVQPNTGVKVSRIVNLIDDIALALAAKDIRIEAPIPGKAAVGIEVPNSEVAIVSLREVLESSQFHESESKLSVGLGRDISGEPIVGNLAKMPHVLVAGATGSGKSVC